MGRELVERICRKRAAEEEGGTRRAGSTNRSAHRGRRRNVRDVAFRHPRSLFDREPSRFSMSGHASSVRISVKLGDDVPLRFSCETEMRLAKQRLSKGPPASGSELYAPAISPLGTCRSHFSALTPFTRSQRVSASSAINDGMRIAGKSRLESGGDSRTAKLLMR